MPVSSRAARAAQAHNHRRQQRQSIPAQVAYTTDVDTQFIDPDDALPHPDDVGQTLARIASTLQVQEHLAGLPAPPAPETISQEVKETFAALRVTLPLTPPLQGTGVRRPVLSIPPLRRQKSRPLFQESVKAIDRLLKEKWPGKVPPSLWHALAHRRLMFRHTLDRAWIKYVRKFCRKHALQPPQADGLRRQSVALYFTPDEQLAPPGETGELRTSDWAVPVDSTLSVPCVTGGDEEVVLLGSEDAARLILALLTRADPELPLRLPASMTRATLPPALRVCLDAVPKRDARQLAPQFAALKPSDLARLWAPALDLERIQQLCQSVDTPRPLEVDYQAQWCLTLTCMGVLRWTMADLKVPISRFDALWLGLRRWLHMGLHHPASEMEWPLPSPDALAHLPVDPVASLAEWDHFRDKLLRRARRMHTVLRAKLVTHEELKATQQNKIAQQVVVKSLGAFGRLDACIRRMDALTVAITAPRMRFVRPLDAAGACYRVFDSWLGTTVYNRFADALVKLEQDCAASVVYYALYGVSTEAWKRIMQETYRQDEKHVPIVQVYYQDATRQLPITIVAATQETLDTVILCTHLRRVAECHYRLQPDVELMPLAHTITKSIWTLTGSIQLNALLQTWRAWHPQANLVAAAQHLQAHQLFKHLMRGKPSHPSVGGSPQPPRGKRMRHATLQAVPESWNEAKHPFWATAPAWSSADQDMFLRGYQVWDQDFKQRALAQQEDVTLHHRGPLLGRMLWVFSSLPGLLRWQHGLPASTTTVYDPEVEDARRLGQAFTLWFQLWLDPTRPVVTTEEGLHAILQGVRRMGQVVGGRPAYHRVLELEESLACWKGIAWVSPERLLLPYGLVVALLDLVSHGGGLSHSWLSHLSLSVHDEWGLLPTAPSAAEAHPFTLAGRRGSVQPFSPLPEHSRRQVVEQGSSSLLRRWLQLTRHNLGQKYSSQRVFECYRLLLVAVQTLEMKWRGPQLPMPVATPLDDTAVCRVGDRLYMSAQVVHAHAPLADSRVMDTQLPELVRRYPMRLGDMAGMEPPSPSVDADMADATGWGSVADLPLDLDFRPIPSEDAESGRSSTEWGHV